jgi:peptidoglycan/LPS O-acetylase OafA/YrhL
VHFSNQNVFAATQIPPAVISLGLPSMNLERGIRKSLIYAAIGFAIPAIVIGLFAIYHFTCHDIHPMDRPDDLARLPALILIPSSGIAILFGMAAFAAFTPNNGITFLRSLIVVSAATMIAMLATRPGMSRKTDDPNAWLETVIPLAVGLFATMSILLYSLALRSQRDGDGANSELQPNREITKP